MPLRSIWGALTFLEVLAFHTKVLTKFTGGALLPQGVGSATIATTSRRQVSREDQ
jgi:hypothetical protein